MREQIRQHDRAYYEQDAPTIPDADYDALVRDLRTPRVPAPRPGHSRQPHPDRRAARPRRSSRRWSTASG
ncbi:MAG: hypothetical protein V9E94_17320 [Microthrixaceae bacterium]